VAEGIDLASPMDVARMALACLDLTDLGEDTTAAATLALCDQAVTPHGHAAAICIWPRFVAVARARLGSGHKVQIATVVNFPSGDMAIADVLGETEKAVADGADEIDLVIPWKALAQGEEAPVRAMVAAVRAAAPHPVRLKTILETGELKDHPLIRRAAEIALGEGADFIKTSTGKVTVNATPEAAEIMLEAIADAGGKAAFKPSGGIRTVADAAAYFTQAERIMGKGWIGPNTFRFGASGLLTDILATLNGVVAGKPGAGY